MSEPNRNSHTALIIFIILVIAIAGYIGKRYWIPTFSDIAQKILEYFEMWNGRLLVNSNL